MFSKVQKKSLRLSVYCTIYHRFFALWFVPCLQHPRSEFYRYDLNEGSCEVSLAWRILRRLFADTTFLTAVKNTWSLWLMNFIPQLGIALLMSVWFTSTRLKIKGGGIWRMLFYLPNLLMPSAIAALFFSLFSFYGPVNQFLVRPDLLPEAVDFIRSPAVMRGVVVFIQWWMWFGQTTILLMAAMTSISVSIYEAATIDGAN